MVAMFVSNSDQRHESQIKAFSVHQLGQLNVSLGENYVYLLCASFSLSLTMGPYPAVYTTGTLSITSLGHAQPEPLWGWMNGCRVGTEIERPFLIPTLPQCTHSHRD